MRLYLFPVTKSRTLIYCRRNAIAASNQITASSAPTSSAALKAFGNDQDSSKDSSKAVSQRPATPPRPLPRTPLIERITAKANETWVKWEAAPGGWKKKVTGWGNQAFARIPYQEWGLKSIPPLSRARRAEETRLAAISRDDADPERRAARRSAEVDIVFPPTLLDPSRVKMVLKQLSGENKGEYKRRIWWSILAMPFTIPFMLIPVVPNLPFFYLVFRAWSYWRAQSGCSHVEHLLKHDLLNLQPSKLLQRVYDAAPVSEQKLRALESEVDRVRKEKGDEVVEDPEKEVENATLHILGDVESTKSKSSGEEEERLLYPKGHGKPIALALNMPEVEAELERAYTQVEKILATTKLPDQKSGKEE